MRSRTTRGSALGLLAALVLACGSADARRAETPTAAATTERPRATTSITATATVAPPPTAAPSALRATRLAVPALSIDADVQPSRIIPDTSPPTPGCPPRPPGGETLSVPNEGIATPIDDLEGLQNKAWIFGHSRWENQPGLFFRLQDIRVGDEIFVDGVDRTAPRRFVVDSLYLTDLDSGDKLVLAESPAAIPAAPVVVLQTSVREEGAGKQWLLNQETVLAKARNMIEGDMNDPCKYLLLFVFARSS